MDETLTDRMLHAAAHCEGMYELLDEAKTLRDGVAEIERLRNGFRRIQSSSDREMMDGDLARDIAHEMLKTKDKEI